MTGAAEAILVALVTTILDLVRRGLLSEECVAGLCAAHPELRGKIDALPAARYRDARRALADRSTSAQDADELPRAPTVAKLRAAARAAGPSAVVALEEVLRRAKVQA